ncbi:MAG: chloride channel protein [Myxococcaceae bacterium]
MEAAIPDSSALTTRLSDAPTSTKRFWVLVVLTGALGGGSAAGLVSFMRWLQHLAWGGAGEGFLHAVADVSWARRLMIPLGAGVLVTIASIALRQPLRGHGTAGIIESIWTRSGKMTLWRTLIRALVSITAVALGAPLGREGALLQTGAASASWLGTRLKVSPDQLRLLVGCGAAAGIAAAYNVPIGAALFGLEVLLGSFALELFGPIVLACVVATLVSRVLIADHPTYLIPHYKLATRMEFALPLLLGPLIGVASAAYVKTIQSFAAALEHVPRAISWFLPVFAMLAVGLAATWYPELLGNGYDTVNLALLGKLSLTLLIALPLLKMVATATAAGAGVPGGLFTPSLFFGALLGGSFGMLAHHFFPSVQPGTYALLGMGGVLAGTTHASVSAILMIFELTGNYDVVLPLMLVCVASNAVSRAIHPDSLYTGVLRKRNVPVPGGVQPGWLTARPVGSLMTESLETVSATAPIHEVLADLLELPPGHDLYVVHPDGRFAGVVLLDAVKAYLPDHSLLRDSTARDVMRAESPILREASLSEAAARFAHSSRMDRLPVVDARGRLVGVLGKSEVLKQARF